MAKILKWERADGNKLVLLESQGMALERPGHYCGVENKLR